MPCPLCRRPQAILEEVEALHEVVDKDHALHFCIGIHTGHAVLGMVGGANRIEFAALGEAPDVGKFLQENAEPGEILISAETYELVQDQVQAVPMAIRKPKAGFERFDPVYRVLLRGASDNGASGSQ